MHQRKRGFALLPIMLLLAALASGIALRRFAPPNGQHVSFDGGGDPEPPPDKPPGTGN